MPLDDESPSFDGFPEGGEMGARVRALDWSRTAVGPVETWPSTLKTLVRTLLECRLPMYLAWGRAFTQFYNDAYRPILGSRKHPQALGASTPDSWPEIWPTIGPMWEEVWKGHAFGSDHFRLTIERNGYPEDCYFNFSYSPVRDESGAVAGVLVTFAETTEQVKSERRLKEERDKLNNVLQNLNEGLFIVDSDGTLLEMNAAALRMHGYASLEEARRETSNREAHFEVSTAERRVLPLSEWPVMRVLRGERFSDVEHWVRLRTREGAWMGSYSGAPLHDAEGHLRLGVISVRDVTEHHQLLENEKAAHRAVEKSEAKFRSIFNLAAVGIGRNDARTGRFLEVNRRFEDITGYSSEELSRLTSGDITHPEDRQQDQDGFRAFLEGRMPSFRAQKRYVRKDGRTVWVNLEVVAGTLDPAGLPLDTVGIVQDITEAKHAQAELLTLTQELQASVQARDEFLSLASHELKTPLTTLKLQAQLLRRGVEKNDPRFINRERLGQLAEQSHRQIARLERLVDDMLDISRIRTGRLTLRPEEADFAALVREVIERMQPQFTAAGLSAPELPVSAPLVGRFDRLRMEQVITNLLTNALRYGRGQPITVRVAEAGERLRLEVSDRGMGIAPENHERIFERFERVVNPSEVSGLGLGLFITRQIVRAHGGEVRVESQLGQGATFLVEIPRTAVAPDEGVHVV